MSFADVPPDLFFYSVNSSAMSETTSSQLALITKIRSVEEFHEIFQIGNRHQPTGTVSEEEYMLRFNLLKEENEGLAEALQEERSRAVGLVMDLFYALRDINGTPTLKDLVKLAKRIKN